MKLIAKTGKATTPFASATLRIARSEPARCRICLAICRVYQRLRVRLGYAEISGLENCPVRNGYIRRPLSTA